MLKNYILNKSISIIKNKYSIDKDTEEVILYGLEGIYLTITKAIIILFLAYKMNLIYDVILFLLFYNLIRLFAFGMHAKSSIVCLISSTFIFLGIPYICKRIIINKIVKIILFSLTTILILIFSPADTEKRPIISKKRRIFYKSISTFVCICYFVIGINSNEFISNLLLFSLITELFLINPLSYKLFGLSYNNYKKYIGKED